MGLTGAILTVRLRLRRLETAYVAVDYHKAPDLDRALELFAAGDDAYTYSVAWIDCLAKGASLGRSVLIRGNDVRAADLPADVSSAPLTPPPARGRSVPFHFPRWVLNGWSVKAFNARFYGKHEDGRRVVSREEYFYPLDSIRHWNRMYGKRGFIQYQCVLPPETSRAGLVELLGRLSNSRRASFLAVLKTFGAQGEGLLSFPRPGHTLALDLPAAPGIAEFARELDGVVLKHGGRVYLAKDACLTRDSFEQMYPNLERFKAVKARLDPDGRFTSSLARRLGIVAAEGA
jgi:FAD/FMN-containing dehydrogenase